MSNNSKNIMLGVLAVGVIAMTVAFAALSTRLNISGVANIPEAKWDIHFESWTEAKPLTNLAGVTNTATQVQAATLAPSNKATLISGLQVLLSQPGDTTSYTFNIVNEGTIDANLSSFTPTIAATKTVNGVTTTANESDLDDLTYTIKCNDEVLKTSLNAYDESTAAVPTQNDALGAGKARTCKLKISYNEVTNTATAGQDQTYTGVERTVTLGADWIWVQGNTSAQSGNSGQGGNEPVTPSNPNETTFDGNYTYTSSSGFETNEYGFVPLDFNNEWNVYLRNDGTKNETCNVFPTGTVCLTNNTSGRESDFSNVSIGTYDSTNISTSGLSGYSLNKAEEMLNKDASYCYVDSDYVSCNSPASGYCSINYDGNVYCDDGDNYCDVSSDGSVGCY